MSFNFFGFVVLTVGMVVVADGFRLDVMAPRLMLVDDAPAVRLIRSVLHFFFLFCVYMFAQL